MQPVSHDDALRINRRRRQPHQPVTIDATPKEPSGSIPASELVEGKIRRIFTTLAVLLGPPLLLIIYFKMTFTGLSNPEALDFAQLGRNLAAGRGFATDIIRPLALGQGTDPLRQPELVHGPLYPVLLGLWFGALGAREWVAVLVSALFFLATIPLVYQLARRIFNARVALIAALIFCVNARMVDYAVSGLHVTLYIFLTTLLLLALYDLSIHRRDEAEDAPLPRGPLAGLGLLSAALYLTEPLFIWIAPVVVLTVGLLYRGRSRPAMGWTLIGFGALAGGWMLRNLALTGDPVFALAGKELMMNTAAYPGDLAYRTLPDDLSPGVEVLKGLLRKVGHGLGEVIETLPTISASWVLAFFIPSLFFRFNNPAANRIRTCLVAIFGMLLLGTLLFRVQIAPFTAVVPVALIFAVAFLQHLMRQAKMVPTSALAASAAFALLVGYPLVDEMLLRPRADAPAAVEYAAQLAPLTRRGDVVLADQPALVAWHSGRPAVLLPADDRRMPDVLRQFPRARWMFLTGQARESSRGWRAVYDGFARGIIEREQRRAKNQPFPEQVRINAKGDPMLEVVSGSTWVPLGERPTLEVIAAALPDAARTHLGYGHPTVPAGP
jgi:hypothetical protein